MTELGAYAIYTLRWQNKRLREKRLIMAYQVFNVTQNKLQFTGYLFNITFSPIINVFNILLNYSIIIKAPEFNILENSQYLIMKTPLLSCSLYTVKIKVDGDILLQMTWTYPDDSI